MSSDSCSIDSIDDYFNVSEGDISKNYDGLNRVEKKTNSINPKLYIQQLFDVQKQFIKSKQTCENVCWHLKKEQKFY